MPVYVDEILHVGPREYGSLLSASGLGAMLAGFTLSYVRQVRRKGMFVMVAAVAAGVFTLFFSVSTWYAASLVFLFGVGATQVVYNALANTTLQLSAPDDMRGRVMGFFSWGSSGLIVVGAIETGILSWTFDAQLTLTVAGVATIAAVLLAILLAPAVRRID